MPDKKLPQISVIVPSFNSALTIGRCLQSILGQITDHLYEIIVVDSSVDDTPEVVKSFGPDVVLVRSEKRLFPGPARNLGIQYANADILAFTDSDCVVDAQWLNNVFKAHQIHDAVGGRIMNGTPESLFGSALYFIEFVEFGIKSDRLVRNVPTCNMSYKKSVFEKYGLFPDVFWGEEYILNNRITEKIRFCGEVVITHMNRTNFVVIVHHSLKVGKGAALSRIHAGQLAWLFKFKIFIPTLWLYRLLKISWKAIQSGNTMKYLAALPIVIIGLLSWNIGFLQGAMKFSDQGQAIPDQSRR